jgi:hypothetical protein
MTSYVGKRRLKSIATFPFLIDMVDWKYGRVNSLKFHEVHLVTSTGLREPRLMTSSS